MKRAWFVYALIALILAGSVGALVSSTETHSSPNAIPKFNERVSAISNASSTTISDTTFDGFREQVDEIAPLLDSLHATAVRSFVSAPEFGANRARLHTLRYSQFKFPVLHLPPTTAIRDAWRQKAYVRVRDYGTTKQLEGYEAWMWIHALYRITARGFVYFEGDLSLNMDVVRSNEVERYDRLLVGMPHQDQGLDYARGQLLLESVSPLVGDDRLWKLTRLELISILQHDPPEAYVHNSDSISSPATTRELDAFEFQALDQLQQGKETVLAWNAEQQQISLVGAIRATQECLKCHDDKANKALLGAFSYQLTIDSH